MTDAPAPLPQDGGVWLRKADGSLTRAPAPEAALAPQTDPAGTPSGPATEEA